MGSFFYLFTPAVFYYGLECAEYNLMLCCMSWTVFFYFKTLHKMKLSALTGFFLFAILSVYSQYGAAFLVTGMYLSLVIAFFQDKNRRMLIRLLLLTVITFFAAVLPLVFLFLIPQMANQGSATVSHIPFFVHGVVYDFFWGIGLTLSYMYDRITVWGVYFLFSICIVSFFLDRKKRIRPLTALAITWMLYYVAVACSFYGYNNYNMSSIGTKNIGGKYSYFLIPFLIPILFTGLQAFTKWMGTKIPDIKKYLFLFFALGITVFCCLEVYRMGVKGWSKEDVREAAMAWYDEDIQDTKTLIHQWNDAAFQFYLTHDKRYHPSLQENIETTGMWIRHTDYNDLRTHLKEMGYLDNKDFYHITPDFGSYEIFLDVMRDEGYSVDTIYEGETLLLHLTKQDI